jgi:hypothetical protein
MKLIPKGSGGGYDRFCCRLLDLTGKPFGCSATLRNTRSNSRLGCSAPTSRAISMNRFDWVGSSGCSLDLRGMRGTYTSASHSSNRKDSCHEASGLRDRRLQDCALERRLARLSAARRRIGQALALCADQDASGAGVVVKAECLTIVIDEITLRRSAAYRCRCASETWKKHP